ncbi:MAG: hypothetical protein KAQ71_22710, partial [Desulfobulbaceae bacterium]|nr:hypothetical protein [Desulfobulbaceae bacterium]
MNKLQPIDFSGLKTYSIHDRFSKVTVDNFAKPLGSGASIKDLLESLPGQFAGIEFPEFVDRLAISHKSGRLIAVGMGAHVIKVGLNPVIIDLMERKVITSIALNGAGIVHDTEVAMVGRTSEDVGSVLGTGEFGAARETGEAVNEAIALGAQKDIGLGKAMGEFLDKQNFPYNNMSLLAAAYRLNIPVTVHVAVGTDIVHIHPSADGAAIGKTTFLDFKKFCGIVSNLEGGAYLNIGSAVLLPEIFLKALTAVRNLGHVV